MPKILIVDDEPDIREMIRSYLTSRGFICTEAEDAEEALKLLPKEQPDLILLDWMLPGRSGLDFAKELKHRPDTREYPVIMLTARTEEANKVWGLDAGADDYVTKPFSPRELMARIQAVLRRVKPQSKDDAEIEFEGLLVEPGSHRVSVDGSPLEMGPTEYRLLHFFVTHPERAYSRSRLIDLVWGNDVYVEERTVDVHIRRLRIILEPSGHDKFIQTVRGTGYRFSNRT
ncbi:MAG: phosphate regulon transcriptional regulatory protein PhoB [Gammaproteobacteria bacterium]|nr:phosphate regulon transcriptional regulatory protein PhoB [Gammaproteobacteria bacterium]